MGADEFSMNLIRPFTYLSVPKSLISELKGISESDVFCIDTIVENLHGWFVLALAGAMRVTRACPYGQC